MRQNPEIYFVTIIGIILGLLLVSFIVAMLVLYKRRQQRQEQEMLIVKSNYDKEILRSQLEIQENTFKTISQELHDNIGQMLSVVKLSLTSLPLENDHRAFDLLKHSIVVLDKAVTDMRGITKSLHTDYVIQEGLTQSIRNELATVTITGLIKTKFSVEGDEFKMPEQHFIYLFRIFQEILNNVLKHSKAAYIFVHLSYGADNTFTMEIEDNGIGFDTAGQQLPFSFSKGVGLRSIYNRSKMIGADIKVSSAVNEGTRFVITLTPME